MRLREMSTGTDLEEDTVPDIATSAQLNVARSRSNSWRGPSGGRRACTILKEESEDEMTSYMRSPSRQSSRLVLVA